jgi:hypothetical protein
MSGVVNLFHDKGIDDAGHDARSASGTLCMKASNVVRRQRFTGHLRRRTFSVGAQRERVPAYDV